MKNKFAIIKRCLLLVLIFFSTTIAFGQNYNYSPESFEESIWEKVDKNPTVIESSTGSWSVYKNNIQSNTGGAIDGNFALVFTDKSGIVTPHLPYGAGTLTFYSRRTGGGRSLFIETSTDNINWNTLSTYAVQSDWTESIIHINDTNVHYVRLRANSNGSLYIDLIHLTSAGSSDINIITNDATNVTQNTANVSAVINTGNSNIITERGIYYNKIGIPDYNSEKKVTTQDSDEFMLELTDLTSGSVYYARAYCVTQAGVNYGNEITFVTRDGDEAISYWCQKFDDTSHFPSSEPVSPQSITVSEQGEWIYYRAYKGSNPVYVPDGSAYCLRMLKNGSYVITPKLEDGVTHLFFDEGRKGKSVTIFTSNNNGVSWEEYSVINTDNSGKNKIFIGSSTVNRIKIANDSSNDLDIDNISVSVYPSGNRPVVATGDATAIAKNSATITGEILAEGDKPVVEKGICWSLGSLPLIGDYKIPASEEARLFTLNLENIPAGKVVYYRAFATSRAGTGYGEVKSFTTPDATIPQITTLLATYITGETALIGGELTDIGGGELSEVGVCWSSTSNPTIADYTAIGKAAIQKFDVTISPLLPLTTYYYRAYAVTEAGIGYGQIETFTTGTVTLPKIKTLEATGTTSFKTNISGLLTDTGNGIITKGFCWSYYPNPTVNDSFYINQENENEFSALIGNLRSNTTYYFTAFATNSKGTSYGEDIVITTQKSNIYHVSPIGNDATGDGSEQNPFYSLDHVVTLVVAGDTIYMKGGTYNYSKRVNIGIVGQENGGTIALFAEPGTRALLDFSAMPFNSNNQGIRLTGSYWHLYGLDIKGAGDNGLLIERNKPVGGNYLDVINRSHEAHHNIIENCSFFENQDTGLQLKNLASYNRIINCDSYFNADPDNGDADGFAPKLTVGTGNYFYGCRAWNNSDDGWDGLLTATENGFPDDITTTLENCWAFNNGYLKDNRVGKGNGNGFKLGGNYQRHNMIVKRCLGFNNLVKSFDQNHNTGDMILINCSGFSPLNGSKNQYSYRLDESVAKGKQIKLVNCVAVTDGKDASSTKYAQVRLSGEIQVSCDFATTPSDYQSIDPTNATMPRNADGSLPDISFMTIASGNSRLIDAGTIYEGINYNGSAPDLGYREYDYNTSIIEVGEELSLEPKVIVYPQPIIGDFTVELKGGKEYKNTSLRIFDISGQSIYQETFYGNIVHVKPQGITSGIYLLHISNEYFVNCQKIIVK